MCRSMCENARSQKGVMVLMVGMWWWVEVSNLHVLRRIGEVLGVLWR